MSRDASRDQARRQTFAKIADSSTKNRLYIVDVMKPENYSFLAIEGFGFCLKYHASLSGDYKHPTDRTSCSALAPKRSPNGRNALSRSPTSK